MLNVNDLIDRLCADIPKPADEPNRDDIFRDSTTESLKTLESTNRQLLEEIERMKVEINNINALKNNVE